MDPYYPDRRERIATALLASVFAACGSDWDWETASDQWLSRTVRFAIDMADNLISQIDEGRR